MTLFTKYTLGTAANKILTGQVTPDTPLDELIAACYLCNPDVPSQCWHQPAKVLLEHGLHAMPRPAALDAGTTADQLALDMPRNRR